MNEPRRFSVKAGFLKSLAAVREAFREAWSRVVLFGFVHGWKLPGLDRARSHLSDEHLAALERQLLVREIKGSRLLVQKGPLWVRRSGEAMLRFAQRNRIFLVATVKVLVGLVFIVLPVGVFVLIRGVLPVPSRIPFSDPTVRLPRHSNLRVEWPYTAKPFRVGAAASVVELPNGEFRGGDVVAVREPGAPAGLARIMVGDFPTRADGFRGFLVSEHNPARVMRQGFRPVDIAGRNRLLVWSYLFPTSRGQERCRLEIRNENDELVLSTESGTPRLPDAARGALGTQLRERLTPGLAVEAGRLREYVLETDVPPSELRMKVQRLDAEPVKKESASANSLAGEACVFAVGQLQFETERVARTGRRGVVLVVVDSLRRRLAFDSGLMPELDTFWKKGGLRFERHFSQGSNSTIAMASLLSSRYFRQLATPEQALDEDAVPALGGMPTLPEVVQRLGYRTGAIGRLSEEDASLWQESVSIENRHYETRSITEEAGHWLERGGNAPFFLYLHYGTLRPPFRPPFSEIHLAPFVLSPFGLAIEEELERGLARTWDKEFGLLLRKLELLGIDEGVDIVVTSDHGVQMSEMNYGSIPGLPIALEGGARSRGPLTDDELHVPLFIRTASNSRTEPRSLKGISTHLDLAPTLVALLGEKPPHEWRGRVLPPLSDGRQMAESGVVYADAPRMAAASRIFADGTQEKLIRQFAPFEAVVFRQGPPWRTKVRWMRDELFSFVDAKGNEEWSAWVRPSRLEELRRSFFGAFPGPRLLRLEPQFAGSWSLDLDFLLDGPTALEGALPSLESSRFPEGTIGQWRHFADRWELRISGQASPGQPSFVSIPPRSRIAMRSPGKFAFVGCSQGLVLEARELARLLEGESCLEFPSETPWRMEGVPRFKAQVLVGGYDNPQQ